jgi:hypothetical protein
VDSIKIKIATEFSATPGPRYIKEGENSGELFRQNVLLPAFKKALSEGKKVIVDLDGTAGYGTSFLEESFGGLVRVEGMDYQAIVKNLLILSEEEDFLKEDVLFYLKDAHEAKQKSK